VEETLSKRGLQAVVVRAALVRHHVDETQVRELGKFVKAPVPAPD
jgi:hypothetical protein